MKCVNCGFEFKEGIFCPECGKKIEITTSPSFDNNPSEDKIQNMNEQQRIEKLEIVNATQTKSANKTQNIQPKDTMGTVSLAAGILSIVTLGCWLLPEIIAIVCGIQANKNKSSKNAKAGIIGTIMFVFILVIMLVFAMSGENQSKVIETTENNVISESITEQMTTEVVIEQEDTESATIEESADKHDEQQEEKAEEEINNVFLEKDWFRLHNRFVMGNGDIIEMISYDFDDFFDIAINGVSAGSVDTNGCKYDEQWGCYIYTSSNNITFGYDPTQAKILVLSGENTGEYNEEKIE